MPSHSLARFSVLGLGVAMAALAGCDSGPARYGVSGTVKYKGEPVKAGSISFKSDTDSGSAPIADGKYDIPAKVGLTPGTYKVSIFYPDPKAPKPKETDLPGDVAPAKELLPAEYNAQTKLTAEVKSQANEVSFDLK